MPLSPAQKRAFIIRLGTNLGLDPRALIAVAMSEGGFSGAVGDTGTSFGPFQLHRGGALPSVANPQAWANSRAGLRYALRQIAGVARGRQGRGAIANIVRRFERPADPAGEIQRALGYYRGLQGVRGVRGVQNARAHGGRARAVGFMQLQPVTITPQNLSIRRPDQVLSALSSTPSYLSQGGRSLPYFPGVSAAPSFTPNPATVQGVSSGDLYAQLADLRRRLLAG